MELDQTTQKLGCGACLELMASGLSLRFGWRASPVSRARRRVLVACLELLREFVVTCLLPLTWQHNAASEDTTRGAVRNTSACPPFSKGGLLIWALATRGRLTGQISSLQVAGSVLQLQPRFQAGLSLSLPYHLALSPLKLPSVMFLAILSLFLCQWPPRNRPQSRYLMMSTPQAPGISLVVTFSFSTSQPVLVWKVN